MGHLGLAYISYLQQTINSGFTQLGHLFGISFSFFGIQLSQQGICFQTSNHRIACLTLFEPVQIPIIKKSLVKNQFENRQAKWNICH